jgi:hypothetical protein
MTQKYDPNQKNSSFFKGGAKNGDNDTLCKNRTMYISVTNLDGTDITSSGSSSRLLATATTNSMTITVAASDFVEESSFSKFITTSGALFMIIYSALFF